MNMMEQIMNEMRGRQAAGATGQSNSRPCGCTGGAGNGKAPMRITVTRTPPELPQTPQPGAQKNIMAEIMAKLKK